MTRARGGGRLTCHHEAGHAVARWRRCFHINGSAILTLDKMRAGAADDPVDGLGPHAIVKRTPPKWVTLPDAWSAENGSLRIGRDGPTPRMLPLRAADMERCDAVGGGAH